jgi:hypothetical protein
MTIKNTISNAERHYDSFINQSDDWNFFLGLAEYVKFVSEEKTSEKIIIEAMEQGKARFKDLSELSKKSIVEMTGVFEKLIGIIGEDKIDFPGLKTEIQEYEDYKNGLMFSSASLPSTLFETLADIIEILVKNNYVDKIRDYVLLRAEPGEGRQYYIKEFTFSNSFLEYEKANKLFNDKRDIEIWGVWDNLVMVYNSVFKKEELITELDKDKKNFWQALNARGVISELNKIKEGKRDNSPVYFKKQDFITKASRFHNYLIKELSLADNRDYMEKNNNRISYQYNEPIGNLTIGDFKPIEFKKIPAKILNYLYSNNKLGNEYKNYNDFNGYAGEDLSSDKFNKAIGEINKRIISDTKFNKVMIESGNTKPPQTKIFRWNNQI